MKFLTFLLVCSFALFAEYKVGEKMTPFELKDQFDKSIQVDESLKIIVLATSKDSGKVGHAYFENKQPSFFDEKKILYISDMSSVPGFVLDMFMMGSFKKYKYRLGLLKDEKTANIMPKKDEHLSVIMLDKMQIKELKFAKSAQELQQLIEK